MKPTGNQNINSKTYWNLIYQNDEKRQEYLDNETIGHPTERFNYALQEISDNSIVLDIGCGVGFFTELVYLKKSNCEVWGVDISDAVIKANGERNPQITYKQGYVGALKDIPANYFDFVFSGEVLEHLDTPEKLFKDAYTALKPGGKFLVTTPVEDNVRSDEHVWEFTHEDIEKLMLSNGFTDPRFIYLPHLEHLMVIMCIGTKQ